MITVITKKETDHVYGGSSDSVCKTYTKENPINFIVIGSAGCILGAIAIPIWGTALNFPLQDVVRFQAVSYFACQATVVTKFIAILNNEEKMVYTSTTKCNSTTAN